MITLLELRNVFLSAKCLAECGKLTFATDTQLQRLARSAKSTLEAFEVEDGATVLDYLDQNALIVNLVEKLRGEAAAEAGDNAEKFNKVFNQKILAEPSINEKQTREVSLWRKKIDFVHPVIKVNTAAVEKLYKAAATKKADFDFSLLFPERKTIIFSGLNFDRVPYSDFQDLIADGYLEII